jgi:sugar lactone lactonase YvrE
MVPCSLRELVNEAEERIHDQAAAKDLKFAEAKAGLYLFRNRDKRVIRLRNDQICSNGKVITQNDDGTYCVLDIDTPKKTVVEYRLDVEQAKLDFVRVALDLNHYDSFPDGMIGTPDGRGVIIAFYDPGDSVCGEARHFDIATGDVVGVWTTPDSPQVTCPQLIQWNGGVKLILTTAVEHMSAERQQRYANAGCLFMADTGFPSLPTTRRVALQ